MIIVDIVHCLISCDVGTNLRDSFHQYYFSAPDSIITSYIGGLEPNARNDIKARVSPDRPILSPNLLHSDAQLSLVKMARGQQKLQSQAKAAEKQSKLKKQQGHSATEQKKAAQKALIHVCVLCKAQMPDPKTYKQHFENKHPKNDLPEDLKAI